MVASLSREFQDKSEQVYGVSTIAPAAQSGLGLSAGFGAAAYNPNQAPKADNDVAARVENTGASLSGVTGIHVENKGDVGFAGAQLASTVKEFGTALFDAFRDKSKDGPAGADNDNDEVAVAAPAPPQLTAVATSNGMSGPGGMG